MKLTEKRVLIGADPELFLSLENRFISAHDVVPGTKNQPFLLKGGAVESDGVTVEFLVDPCYHWKDFHENMILVLENVKLFVEKVRPGAKLCAEPTALFDKKYFDSLPDYVKELGCQPDFNAYSGGKPNPKPSTKEPFRTGAGHIHVGWTKDENPDDTAHTIDCIKMVKQLDSALFVPSHSWDHDRKRRTLYGQMGSYRPKHYGVEYRPLSNRWVADPEVGEWVFGAVQKAAQLLSRGVELYQDKALNKILYKRNQDYSEPDVIRYYDLLQDKGFDMAPFPEYRR